MDGTTQLLESDRRYLVHPLHHPDDHRQPLVVVDGKGAMLRDAEGREYIDGLAGLWNVNIGHGRGELADAASAQMRRIAFASAYIGATNEPAVRLAEKIVRHAYRSSAAVYFTTAGAESNESSFKFARYYWKVKDQPQKTKIISRIHAYHGVTMAAMSATGMAAYHKMFGPLVPGFIQVAPPYAYRWSGNEEPGLGAADAVEKAMLAEGLVERAAVMGRRLLAGLEALRDLPVVGDVRGLGMMCGVELVTDRSTKAPALGLGARITRAALSRGLLPRIRAGSADPPIGDTICLAPPLTTPPEVLDRIPQILCYAIAAATR